MNFNHLSIGSGLLVVGFASGFILSNFLNRNSGNLEPTTSLSSAGTGAKIVTDSNGMLPDIAAVIDAARNQPNDFGAQMKVAELYIQIQRSDRAIEFLDKAAAIGKLDFEKLVTLGNSYFDLREYNRARLFYEKAKGLNPTDVDVRADLGATYVEGQPSDAQKGINEYTEALKIKPNHEPTLHNLGMAQLKIGDYAGASNTLLRLEAAAPNNELAKRLRDAISAAKR